MTKTPEEIKKGLEEEVPVHYHIDGEQRLTPRLLMDMQWLHKDALALIQQLQAENTEKAETIERLNTGVHKLIVKIQQLEAERDAAVEGLKSFGGCMACTSANVLKRDSPCKECIHDGQVTRDYWQWRGAQKEE